LSLVSGFSFPEFRDYRPFELALADSLTLPPFGFLSSASSVCFDFFQDAAFLAKAVCAGGWILVISAFPCRHCHKVLYVFLTL